LSTLTEKVALVTGGSRGIGAAIAKRLAKDGASVAITYAKDDKAASGHVNLILLALEVARQNFAVASWRMKALVLAGGVGC